MRRKRRDITPAEAVEIERLNALAKESDADGCHLDAWAYRSCARDIREQAACIDRCGCCGQIKRRERIHTIKA